MGSQSVEMYSAVSAWDCARITDNPEVIRRGIDRLRPPPF